MDVLMVALRLIHVISGVLWAGSVFFFVSFVLPSASATGAEGQKFMQHLGLKSSFVLALTTAATLTMLSGLLMYWRLFGIRAEALTHAYSLFLALGGLAGIAAWIVAVTVNVPVNRRMRALSATIQAAGGPPRPEQLAEMGALAGRGATGARTVAVLLVLALLFMSTAQYAG